jgi:hypothetical protein
MTRDEKEKLLNFVDRGSWKHSWHMKRDELHHIDFANEENLATMRRCIAAARKEANCLIVNAQACEDILNQSNARPDAPGEKGLT